MSGKVTVGTFSRVTRHLSQNRLIRPSVSSLIHSLTHSLKHSFIHSFIQSFK